MELNYHLDHFQFYGKSKMQNYIFPISNLNVYIVGALCYSLFSMLPMAFTARSIRSSLTFIDVRVSG